MTQITIAGFSSSDKVPGFYGQTLTGQGPSSIQSIPLLLLVAGIMSTSTGVGLNNTVYPITSVADADNYFGPGLQASRMCYAALKIPGVILYGIGLAPVGTASTLFISISGSWTTTGTLTYRINGQSRSITVASTDTPQTVGTNLANDINSQLRWPCVAAAPTLLSGTIYQVVLTHKSAGAGGNFQLSFLDTTQTPTGLVASLGSSNNGGQPGWKLSTPYQVGSIITGTSNATGFYFKCTTAGTSGAGPEPTWNTTILGTTTTSDGGATWTVWGTVNTGNVTSFGGGTGAENATNALAAIINQQYDRVALGHNDATNAALWKTQVDAQAGPISNILEQVVIATNGSSATAQALAGTTINDTRFQVLRYLNCETHPSEIAATFAALREAAEGGNWVQQYDNVILPGVAPQTQPADIPNHATMGSDLNNGVTPVTTVNGTAQIVRSIVTHCLTGSTPDYSTLDTSDMTVPDQIRQDLRLYWTSFFKPANPVVADNPATSAGGQLGAFPPSGVATPNLWNVQVYGKLKAYERGDGFPTPQIVNVDANRPVTAFDYSRKCLVSAVSAVPIAGQHQIGVSVRGLQQSPF